AAELAIPEPEAGLLRRREGLYLAMGEPGGNHQALRAPGQGALRRRDAVHAALNPFRTGAPQPPKHAVSQVVGFIMERARSVSQWRQFRSIAFVAARTTCEECGEWSIES